MSSVSPGTLQKISVSSVTIQIPYRHYPYPTEHKVGKLYNKNAHSMYGGECDAAIAKAAAAVTHVQSHSQEVGSGDEGLGLLCFDL